jgi:4-hydroxy-3-methylbut-2-enyl diphosphate reductase
MYSKGIVKVPSLEEIPDGAFVMFSAHGVTPEAFDRAEEKDLTIIDGTCPVVKSVQLTVKKYSDMGKRIILIGNRTHPEVIALTGYIKESHVFIVHDESDCDLLPDFGDEEVLYFTQTTLDSDHVDRVIRKIREKVPNVSAESQNNTCCSTLERQFAVRNVARIVDLIIVLGSSYSANAKALEAVAISAKVKKAVRIDSENDFDLALMEGVASFAIATASSTPETVLNSFLNFLNQNIEIEIRNYDSKIDEKNN